MCAVCAVAGSEVFGYWTAEFGGGDEGGGFGLDFGEDEGGLGGGGVVYYGFWMDYLRGVGKEDGTRILERFGLGGSTESIRRTFCA